MKRSQGLRSGSRKKFTRAKRERGLSPITHILEQFSTGESVNIVIDPSPEGAVGSAYYGIILRPHEEGQEATGRSWGIYNDRLVKTADGWRFKYRKYTPGGWEHPEEWAAH